MPLNSFLRNSLSKKLTENDVRRKRESNLSKARKKNTIYIDGDPNLTKQTGRESELNAKRKRLRRSMGQNMGMY